MSQFYFTRRKKSILLCILMITMLLLLYFFSFYHINASSRNIDDSMVYDIVLDAGSTGSRIHVFAYKKTGDTLDLLFEHFKRVEPGLSSFALSASAAVDSLKPLLDVAISAVPWDRQKSTAVSLKATAGLRLLPKRQQISLLNAVDAYLNSTPFSNRGVSLISGAEEAVYGWMTLNYLLGLFYSDVKAPIVAIDMGGASTQIVFKTPAESGEWLPFRYAMHLKIKNAGVTLYHHSYLGFGLNEARKTIQNTYNHDQMLVCFSEDALDTNQFQNVSKDHSTKQNFDSCVDLVKEAMFAEDTCGYHSCGVKGIPQPLINAREYDIYVFSYFYDLLHQIMSVDEPLQVGSIREAAEKICTDSQHPNNKGTFCLDLAYLYTYLYRGLKLSNTTFVHVAEQIRGQSLSWPLGDSLSHLWKAVVTRY